MDLAQLSSSREGQDEQESLTPLKQPNESQASAQSKRNISHQSETQELKGSIRERTSLSEDHWSSISRVWWTITSAA